MASDKTYRPIGYAWLAEEFKVAAMPHHVESFVAEPGERKTIEQANGRIREIHISSSSSPSRTKVTFPGKSVPYPNSTN